MGSGVPEREGRFALDMTSARRPMPSRVDRPLHRRVWCSLFAIMIGLLALSPLATTAQSASPVASPTSTPAPEATVPPVVEAATGAGSPAILATGLVYLPGTDVVWSVEEKSFGAPADAKSQTGPTSIIYQRAGTAIVRNDVTAKRAQLDPGAAYFLAANDPYTIFGGSGGMGGSGSAAWAFRIGSKNDVPSGAFYEGPAISGIREGTYSMTLTRYVLRADEEAQIGAHTGSSLVMVTSGQIDVDVNDGQGANRLGVKDGKTVANTASVHNSGTAPAVYVVLAIGGEVGDETAGQPQAQPTANATAQATQTANTANSTADAVQNPSETTTSSGGTAQQDANGNYITSINITAVDQTIFLVVTVDGVTIFNGNLEPGQMTGAMVGSSFTVYTSIGVATQFTNACGETFTMGTETGEANYTLTASASSCAP